MKKISPSAGTTLIELILYMGLLSIFLLMIFNLFATILASQTRSVAVSLVQTNGNFILTKLTHDINQADSIITPLTVGTSDTSMVLRVGTSDSDYNVSDGRLVLTDSTGASNLNDTDTTVSDFVVKRLGNFGGRQGLQISFTITSNVIDNTSVKTKSFQTFASLR
ncbi:MAG: hypothetical protein WC841_05700 [Candidatus Shapirobacteria bacterium]|jgi:hypothetical protein